MPAMTMTLGARVRRALLAAGLALASGAALESKRKT